MTSSPVPRSFSRRAFISCGRRVALGLPCLALAGCDASEKASKTPSSDDRRWRPLIGFLEREIPSLLARSRTTPGASMAIVSDAKPVWSRGFGVKDRISNAPVDADTVFEFGSVSKTVFAYAVMKACEKRILDLDTPLTRYTSERYLPGDARLDLITPRHVLSHTSGFQDWRSQSNPLQIRFTPGARWDYSGEGYHYLQSVLTHLTGRVDTSNCKTFEDRLRVCATDFESYMKRTLLVPFGMASSGYSYHDGMAAPHDDKGRLIPDRKTTAIEAARYGSAGALHSTVNDYARFLVEIIAPRPADAYRLDTRFFNEMIRPHVKITDTLWWGLGWAIERHPGMGDILSHSGDNPGFKAMTAVSLRRQAAFIIVTNGDRGFDEVIRPLLRSTPMRDFLPVTV